MADRPSGDPAWEGPKSRGLPRVAPATGGDASSHGEGSAPARPVARWLGWSPTSWRTSR
jgi:hypothetical protein